MIDAYTYLEEVSRYIHLNPVRLKKYGNLDTKEIVTLLKKSKYNSFDGYTNQMKREPFLNYSTILDYFGGDTKEGRRRYRQFVNNGLGNIHDNPLDSGRGTGMVGSDSFVERIRDTYLPKENHKENREQPQLKKVKKKFNPEEFIHHYCRIVEVDRESVCRKGKYSSDRSIMMELLEIDNYVPFE